MKPFPYTLLRLGGISFDQWEKLDSHILVNHTNTIIDLRSQLQKEKLNLSDKLLEFNQDLTDVNCQNIIQNIRRDIFNERKLKNNKLKKIRELLPPALNDLLEDYLQKKIRLKSLVEEGGDIYNSELHKSRTEFKKLINDSNLQKGLILSSRSLLNRLYSYQQKDIKKFRKKENQTELSLVKYLTRMCAKTSPFSTFTNLGIATIADNGQQESITIKHTSSEEKIKGHIRLNNYLFKFLADLLKHYRPAYLKFYLRKNPTIEAKEDHYVFLTNNNNVEAFQRMPLNPVLDLILNNFESNSKGVRFDDIILLLQEQVDAEREELESYIKQVIDYGFLEYNLGVSGIDPDWDLKFCSLLDELKDIAHITELSNTLKEIRQLSVKYAKADVATRKEILNNAYESLRNACLTIHEAAGLPEDERKTVEERTAELDSKKEKQTENNEEVREKDTEEKEEIVFKHQSSTYFNFKPEQLFYEDSTRIVSAEIRANDFQQFISKVDTLINSMAIYRGYFEEKEKMKQFFLDKYDQDASVSALTYYEDYFREVKKPEKEKQEKIEKGEKSSEEDTSISMSIQENRKKVSDWEKSFVQDIEVPENGEMKLSNDSLLKANKSHEIKPLETVRHNSYGSFVQFYEDDGALKAVMNSNFAGYGKMVSRFLHILDDDVTNKLRDWNDDMQAADELFIEDCDASYFNANLHPPLMSKEIWMPGGHNNLPPKDQVPITDLSIVFNKKEKILELRHSKTGKKVNVFDLGFQGHMGRSQLFQLLEKFTKVEYVYTRTLAQIALKSINEKTDEKDGIRFLPRVIFENDIVLERQSWIVNREALPTRQPEHTDWHYYLAVNEWRKSHNIPDEIFAVINESHNLKNIDEDKRKKLSRDDYKPQYINFNNMFLVSLFEKMIDKVPIKMKIQEMLPKSSQMVEIDGEKYVSECVVQWYNN